MPASKRLLLTNNTLASRAGSELYVRDVALELARRGWRPVAYSPLVGDVAADLRLGGVPVVEDLQLVTEAPELIHGQHHLETFTALQRFPHVPAVYFCHGVLPWEETPLVHPRIVRYVAIDDVVREWLISGNGIPAAQVTVIRNFVDMGRFKPRPSPPPLKPRRALICDNEIAPGPAVDALREVCSSRGIQLDVAGARFGRIIRTEDSFAQYDLVFARGRTALEALVVGAAVVLLGPTGCGPLLTPENLASLRNRNFGFTTFQNPVTADFLLREMDRYDPARVREVSEIIRRTASLESAVDAIESCYRDVLAGFSMPDATAERESSVRYLRWLSLATKERALGMMHLPPLRRRIEALENEVARLEGIEASARAETEALNSGLAASEDAHRQSKALDAARIVELEGSLEARSAEVQSLTREIGAFRHSAAFRLRERLHRSRSFSALYRILRGQRS